MVLKSGEELIVKILEISDEEIKYKKCEYLNGPTYVIKKNKIYMIKYFNGTREYIIPENVPPSADKKEYAGEGEYDYGYQLPKQKEYSSDKNNKLLPPPSILVYAFVALVAGMGIPFLPFADSLLLALANLLLIGSLFWSRQAKRIILKNPGEYKGLGWANFLMYFNLVMWVLSLILLMALLSVVNSNETIIMLAIIFTLLILLIFFATSKKSDF